MQQTVAGHVGEVAQAEEGSRAQVDEALARAAQQVETLGDAQRAAAGGRAQVDEALARAAQQVGSLGKEAQRAVAEATEAMQQTVAGHVGEVARGAAGGRAQVDEALARAAQQVGSLRKEAKRAVAEATEAMQQ